MQLPANKFQKLAKMSIFHERHKLPKLTLKEINNMNTKIEFVV